MSGNWINIYNFCYNTVVLEKKLGKTVKNCSFRILYGQKVGQHGPHPKSSWIFCVEVAKGDHKLSRTFYFIKISYVLTELWVMTDFLSWYFLCDILLTFPAKKCVIGGVKGQKMVENGKKLCLLHSISQEPYYIWLSFMVQMCKVIIFQGVFFNVKILIFQVIKVLKGEKMAQNEENFCLLHLIFQEPYNHIYHIIFIYCFTCIYKKIISPGIVFIFFSKFWFLGSLGGRRGGVLVKGQKITQNEKEFCLSHFVSQEKYIMYCDFWCTCVKYDISSNFFSFFKILI